MTPPLTASGTGTTVTDVDGNTYVDLVASWGPLILGHADAAVVSAIGIAAFVGRLVMGGASDKIGRKLALALALTLQAVAFLGFLGVGGLHSLYLASLGFGFSYGAISTLFPAMVSDFFGRKEAGSLVGFLFTLCAPAAAVGPVGAGWIYDTTGSYTWAFGLSAIANGVSLALLAFARPPVARRAQSSDLTG